MQQTITAKLQILVNTSDKQIICDTMKAYSNACNYVSEYIYKTHNLSRYSVQENTYYQIREIFGLRSQMAVSCVRTVIAKYKTVLENQKEWIKPVFKLPQLDLVTSWFLNCPCTESYFKRYASISGLVRSFIAAISMPLSSKTCLNASLPIRPNPLIAIFISATPPYSLEFTIFS